MTITDVRVRKVAKDGKMKAVVSITLDEEFVVHDIKVIEGEKGGCSSQCQAARQQAVSTATSRIQSIHTQESAFRK